MGVQGLLPLLASIQKPCFLKKFDGQTIGVDAYGWLHRGTAACAMELATGKPTKKFVDFSMRRVRLLQKNGITPYIVFDGDFLPSKAITENERAKKREESKRLGRELERAGKISDARKDYIKAIDVTPEMAKQFIDELKKFGVQYIVAPYEADAQLVYLERQGIISAILSEDSDLLVFGAKCLLTKLDDDGACIEINKSRFCACKQVSLTGWSDVQFRQMAILSGCDYLKSINGMGLKTAYRLIRKHKTIETVVRMLQFEGKFSVPGDYLEKFRQAELTFLHQWVFCPRQKKLVFHTEPAEFLDPQTMPYIGAYVEPEMAQKVACGDVNPITKEPIGTLPRSMTQAPPGFAATIPRVNPGTASHNSRGCRPGSSSIQEYFPRIPLGEMNVNSFLANLHQQDRMTPAVATDPAEVENLVHHPRPEIVLPRVYIPPSQINLSPKREDSLTHATSPVLPLSRRRTDSSTSIPDFPAAKRARSGDHRSSSPSESRSRFFHSTHVDGKSRSCRRGRNGTSEITVFSDDSIDELMADSWDEMHEAAVRKSAETILTRGGRSKGTGQSSHAANASRASIASFSYKAAQAPPTPADTPPTSLAGSLGKKYSFASTPSGPLKTAATHTIVNGLPTPQSERSDSPLTLHTPAERPSQPRGALQSILHRMATRVLPPGHDPTLPKPLPKKFKVPFPEVVRPNDPDALPVTDVASPACLPAVPQEGIPALSSAGPGKSVRHGGSEDAIIHDSEDEEDEPVERPSTFDSARVALT